MASGGSISYANGWTIHTFASSGNFVVDFAIKDARILLVAGGGGGSAGGGSGGQVLQYTGLSITAGTKPITIGAGGAGLNADASYGQDGGDTSALGYTATKGAGGAPDASNGKGSGYANGSGAGADLTNPYYGGTGSDYTGGNATWHGYGYEACGGGAGAGGNGGSATAPDKPGNGGVGEYCDITGTNLRYAGGGGGGLLTGAATGGMQGGDGGGGDGTDGTSGGDADFYGGGGGGAGSYGSNGGDGYDGVVIIAYRSNEDMPQQNLALNF